MQSGHDSWCVRSMTALLFCLATAPCVLASSITLSIAPGSFLSNGQCGIDLRVTNLGDAPAQDVYATATLGDRAGTSKPGTHLAPGQSMTLRVMLGPAPQPPGCHTVVAVVHYSDANGYPFSAVKTVPLFTDEPAMGTPSLSATLQNVSLRHDGVTLLQIKNLADHEIQSTVRLAFPAELPVEQPPQALPIPPGETESIQVTILNQGGLPDSTYAVFAVIDWEEEGRQQSRVAPAQVSIVPPTAGLQNNSRHRVLWAVVPLLLLFGLVQLKWIRSRLRVLARWPALPPWCLPATVLAAILCFTLGHLAPSQLISDTLTVGGDTPAHAYLASHLKAQLFGHGRIVSWAGGWWCGFPMFQFYFSLPYLLTALLSYLLPFNIAFKLISVLGICALPPCAYASARLLRLPRPGPLLVAIAMLPFLFDHSHTMWGVNIYSTLAGMISNSLSFPIMLLFIGCAYRDSDAGKARPVTILLLVALLASHFFTSIIAGLTLMVLPLLRPRAKAGRALLALAVAGGIGGLMMAWWLLPLLTKQAYTAPFGTNWNVDILATLPRARYFLVVLGGVALIAGLRRGSRFVAVTAWMLFVAAFLFAFGYAFSNVFVNVRLWPFMAYATFALAAAGLGFLLHCTRSAWLAVIATLLAVMAYGPDRPREVREWAAWNYSGLERKPHAAVFEKLVKPLKGTPGRLANDLHPANNALGSTRIFESVPHLIGKPILEGGLVNSAAGSLFSYYIQGETSRNSAGFPSNVKPATFNFTNATAHLELFNVKQFIAYWPTTQQALQASPAWRLLGQEQGWQLYELTTHDGGYVGVPRHEPIYVTAADWQAAGLEWIYTIAAVAQPFVFLPPGRPAPGTAELMAEATFTDLMQKARTSGGKLPNGAAIDMSSVRITEERVDDNRIKFRTNAPGLPHIVKCTYYPNWKLRGGGAVFMVSPCFMLVYPQAEEVELYYGSTFAETIGRALTALGGIALLALAVRRRGRLVA